MTVQPRPAARRQRNISRFRLAIARPETGALVGLFAVLIFFSLTVGVRGFLSMTGATTIVAGASEVGILGAVVTLLMVAGEFDLSVGSMIGATTMVMALLLSEGVPFWACLVVALAMATTVGLIHAALVVRLGLPSLVVTLASLFILRGMATYIYLQGPGPLAPGWQGYQRLFGADPLTALLSTQYGLTPISVVWFVAVVVVCTYALTRTSFGNWIFATGGSRGAARVVGVPTARVRTLLFVATATTATMIAAVELTSVGAADGTRGLNREFEVILSAFIGGTILGGGWGSPIGTAVGALTLSTVRQGLSYSLVWSDAYQAFMGLAVLGAVVLNEIARRRAAETH
jgi:simple sugar transport system permease protein